MGGFFRQYRGSASATGVVTMNPDPDYARGREAWSEWLAVMGVRRIALQATGLDGTVTLQGCDGDPSDATQWTDIGELTADGRITVEDKAVNFIRVNKTVQTSGTSEQFLTLEA